MVKTIQVSEKNYAKIHALLSHKIQSLASRGEFKNPGFDDVITELLESKEKEKVI